MRSPLDSYGGPCLQPPSTLAKHGAGLPGTCPPNLRAFGFLSLALVWPGTRHSTCQLPSILVGQGLMAPPPRQQWYRCGACPGVVRPGQPPLKGGRGGCRQRVDCNGALARNRTGWLAAFHCPPLPNLGRSQGHCQERDGVTRYPAEPAASPRLPRSWHPSPAPAPLWMHSYLSGAFSLEHRAGVQPGPDPAVTDGQLLIQP